MGIFDFLKNKNVVESGEVADLFFGNVREKLDERSNVLVKNEAEVLREIKKGFDDFYVFVEEKLAILEGVDIESKKEHERVKLLVRQGLDKYVDFVRGLLKDLKALEKNDLDVFSREVSEVFDVFEMRSYKVYDRATYLIGDEMSSVRSGIRKFRADLIKVLKKNKKLIENLEVVRSVELKLSEVEKVEADLKNFRRGIEENNVKIDDGKKKIRELEVEVEVIKKGSEYILNLERREGIEIFWARLDDEITKLRGLIDFKKLASVVHGNQKEFEFVKNYRDFFVLEFSRDGGSGIIELFKSLNMRVVEIEAQIFLIKKMKRELDEESKIVVEDSTISKLEEVKKISEKIKELEIDNVRIGGRLKEFGLKLEGLKVEVVEEMRNVFN